MNFFTPLIGRLKLPRSQQWPWVDTFNDGSTQVPPQPAPVNPMPTNPPETRGTVAPIPGRNPPPPAQPVAAAKLYTKDLMEAVQRLDAAWNHVQFEDAMRSVAFIAGKMQASYERNKKESPNEQ